MPEGQCTWRGTWQLSITDPTIVADFRPTLELQYKSSWSLVSTTVGYRLLSVCTNLVIIVKVGRALVYLPRGVRVMVSMAELMHEALF